MHRRPEGKLNTSRTLQRRDVLKGMGVAGAAILASRIPGVASAAAATMHTVGTASMPFELPALPYAFDALEPYIDALTMEIHHDRHHAAYTNNLNTALAPHEALLGGRSAEDLLRNLASLPADIQTAVRNNGGGYVNHNLFWEVMAPGPSTPPAVLLGKIEATFGSFDTFKTAFADAAAKRFGSGWAWLVVDGFGSLQVYSTANQDSPYMSLHVPILGLDVWEHAYYLKYQNKRADYVTAFWNVVNWDAVAQKYDAALGMMPI